MLFKQKSFASKSLRDPETKEKSRKMGNEETCVEYCHSFSLKTTITPPHKSDESQIF